MRRNCDICGREYDARRSDSRMCSAACRQRRSRGAEPPPAEETPLLIATRQELEAAGKLETMLGQQALALAARMSGTETLGGIASLSRELRVVMTAAVGSMPKPGVGDSVDELRQRRDTKQGRA
jgi:hypothetical protein